MYTPFRKFNQKKSIISIFYFFTFYMTHELGVAQVTVNALASAFERVTYPLLSLANCVWKVQALGIHRQLLASDSFLAQLVPFITFSVVVRTYAKWFVLYCKRRTANQAVIFWFDESSTICNKFHKLSFEHIFTTQQLDKQPVWLYPA